MARVRQPSIPPRNSGHVIRRLGDATPEFNGERSNSISRAQFILLHFLVSVPHPPRQPRLFVVGWHFLLPDAIPQFLRTPPPPPPRSRPSQHRLERVRIRTTRMKYILYSTRDNNGGWIEDCERPRPVKRLLLLLLRAILKSFSSKQLFSPREKLESMFIHTLDYKVFQSKVYHLFFSDAFIFFASLCNAHFVKLEM